MIPCLRLLQIPEALFDINNKINPESKDEVSFLSDQDAHLLPQHIWEMHSNYSSLPVASASALRDANNLFTLGQEEVKSSLSWGSSEELTPLFMMWQLWHMPIH